MSSRAESASHFTACGNLLSPRTPEGLTILKKYLKSANSNEMPQLPGALGFDSESDGLEILFEEEKSAQAALTILAGLLNSR